MLEKEGPAGVSKSRGRLSVVGDWNEEALLPRNEGQLLFSRTDGPSQHGDITRMFVLGWCC